MARADTCVGWRAGLPMVRRACIYAAAFGIIGGLSVVSGPAALIGADGRELASLRGVYARPVSEWPPPWIAEGVAFVELGAPEPNPSPDEDRARLGERLFRDPILSRDGNVSCATCHDPGHAWADGRSLPIGAERAVPARNVPSLLGVARRGSFGWDGEGTTLGGQSLRPLTHLAEMGNPDLASVVSRLEQSEAYGPLFVRAYGDWQIDEGRIADALAAFQAGLEELTRFDAFVRGDHSQLSDTEIRGLHLFRTKAGCANCHFGPLLTDWQFHNLGLSAFREPREDLGRYRVTGHAEHAGQFRTPSLRHVGRTAPYMHTGLFPTLGGVVSFYARGGGEVWARNESETQVPLYREVSRIDPLLRPLTLDAAERAALTAFLQSL